jgi:hypothetical protein
VVAAQAGARPFWLRTQLTLTAGGSFLFVALGLWPHATRSSSSDGAKLRVLLRGGPPAERLTSLMFLFASSCGGGRPREWDPEMVRRATLADGGSWEALAGQAFRYNWLLDTGQHDEAEKALESILARKLSASRKRAWSLEAACFFARIRRNPDGRAAGSGPRAAPSVPRVPLRSRQGRRRARAA